VREAEEKRGNEKRTNDVIKKLNRKHDKKWFTNKKLNLVGDDNKAFICQTHWVRTIISYNEDYWTKGTQELNCQRKNIDQWSVMTSFFSISLTTILSCPFFGYYVLYYGHCKSFNYYIIIPMLQSPNLQYSCKVRSVWFGQCAQERDYEVVCLCISCW
jgi:hypothetical protein